MTEPTYDKRSLGTEVLVGRKILSAFINPNKDAILPIVGNVSCSKAQRTFKFIFFGFETGK